MINCLRVQWFPYTQVRTGVRKKKDPVDPDQLDSNEAI